MNPTFTDPLQGAQFLVEQNGQPVEKRVYNNFKLTVYRTDVGEFKCYDFKDGSYLLKREE